MYQRARKLFRLHIRKMRTGHFLLFQSSPVGKIDNASAFATMRRDCPYQGHFSCMVRQGIPAVLLFVESLELKSGPEAAALRWFSLRFRVHFGVPVPSQSSHRMLSYTLLYPFALAPSKISTFCPHRIHTRRLAERRSKAAFV